MTDPIKKMCDLHKAIKEMDDLGVNFIDRYGPTLRFNDFLKLFEEYEVETVKNEDGSEFDTYIANVDGTEFTAYSPMRYPNE